MTSTTAAKVLPGAAGRRTAGRKLLAGLPWLAGASLLAIGQADAAQFEFQGIRGFLDTTVSTGVFFRMEEEDGSTYQSIGERNFDDFGDIVTATTKATHDLGLDFGAFGLFGRLTYFYDPVYSFKDNVRKLPPEVRGFDQDRYEYDDTAESAEFDIDLLDYFLYTDYQISESSAVHFRIGSQVISWGESLFFPLGINSINPVDAAKSRAPGAEVKEILIPIPLVWTGVDITPNWSVEAFYQLKWDAYEIDPVGSFFSVTDLLGDGPGFIRLPGAPFGVTDGDAFIPRVNPDTPKDTGQWGINTHFTVPALAYTDFGFYYMKLASRIPLLAVEPATIPGDPSTAAFHEIYPEGIDHYGASFNTNIGNTAVQGEYIYRPNFPMIRNPGDFVAPAVFGISNQTYDRVGYHQAQASVIYVTPPDVIPTTDQMSIATELVYGRIDGHGSTEKWYEDVTHSHLSWRAVLGPQWNNAFIMPGLGYMSLRGTVDFQIGIEGKAPPFGAIRENQQVTRLALAAVYLDRFEAGIEYSIFTGEDSRTLNKMRERDYAGITLKYSF